MQYRASMSAIAMGAAAPAQALVTACVDTVEEFDAAYQQAQDDDVEIRIVRGSYDMSSSCIGFVDNQFRCQFIDEAITLRGGYAPGCGSRTLDATDTVLIGSGSGAGGPGFRMDTRDPIVLDALHLLAVRRRFHLEGREQHFARRAPDAAAGVRSTAWGRCG